MLFFIYPEGSDIFWASAIPTFLRSALAPCNSDSISSFGTISHLPYGTPFSPSRHLLRHLLLEYNKQYQYIAACLSVALLRRSLLGIHCLFCYLKSSELPGYRYSRHFWMKESPAIMDPASRRTGQILGERGPLPRPSVFVRVEFGVSWNKRHSPSSHTLTYMSRNLRNSRDLGNFPRQVPPATTNYLAAPAETREAQPREQAASVRPRTPLHGQGHQPSRNHPRRSEGDGTQSRRAPAASEHRRHRIKPVDESRLHPTRDQPREARSGMRAPSVDRGNSEPPPLNESPWDTEGPSSTLFPPPGRRPRSENPQVMAKPLPPAPDQFRLGSDGLPWDAHAWLPGTSIQDEEDPGYESTFDNKPTVVPLSAPRNRAENTQQAQELESLSTAMMTIDNGFENQWWYQGPRESTQCWERSGPATMWNLHEAMLASAAEPTYSAVDGVPGTLSEDRSGLNYLVSPLSATSGSPAQSFMPLRRTLTTKSEELFMEA